MAEFLQKNWNCSLIRFLVLLIPDLVETLFLVSSMVKLKPSAELVCMMTIHMLLCIHISYLQTLEKYWT